MTENELEIFDRPIDVINWISRMSNLEFFKNVAVIPHCLACNFHLRKITTLGDACQIFICICGKRYFEK